jgi:NADH-quinone oxidoreductase subunit A
MMPAMNGITPILASGLSAYLPVAVLVLMAVIFATVNIIGAGILGPKSHGDAKDQTYESGMNPVGTARKRFNIRFYILAMTFLVFDIEIIFLYPWAVDFTQLEPLSSDAGIFFGRILFFILTSIVAYVYAWKKGVFRWD